MASVRWRWRSSWAWKVPRWCACWTSCAPATWSAASDASDRRANLLWLTDAGHALVSELEDQLIGLRQDVFGELSMDELHAVLKAWRLLAEAADRIT